MVDRQELPFAFDTFAELGPACASGRAIEVGLRQADPLGELLDVHGRGLLFRLLARPSFWALALSGLTCTDLLASRYYPAWVLR